MRYIALVLSYFSVILTVYVLSAGSSFFIPLAISFVATYILIAITESIGSIKISKKKMPKPIAFIGSLLLLILGIYVIVTIIEKNIAELISRSDIYEERFLHLMSNTSKYFNLDYNEFMKDYNLAELFKEVLLTITQIAGSAGIILVYILFMLIEYAFYDKKLKALFPDPNHLEKAKKITEKIGFQIQSYLKIKTWISLATGILVYIVLKPLGVDFAEFWALLTFFLNYIPTIGSIIATAFPMMLTLVQFDSFIPFIIVTSVLISIHFFIGNVIEPRIMGNQFNLSGLVILLSLIIWGKMWGVIGMFLCVPLLMIINIILANFPATRPVAVLLSQNGKVE